MRLNNFMSQDENKDATRGVFVVQCHVACVLGDLRDIAFAIDWGP